jgi:hypothetical protein
MTSRMALPLDIAVISLYKRRRWAGGTGVWPFAGCGVVSSAAIRSAISASLRGRLRRRQHHTRRWHRHPVHRESSRYKTPQRTPPTGRSEERSERQRPMHRALMTHRPGDDLRRRDSLAADLLPSPVRGNCLHYRSLRQVVNGCSSQTHRYSA